MSTVQFPVDKMGKTQEKPAIHIVLATAFCRECGFRYLPYMPDQFLEWLHWGFEPALLFYAIDKTARAPRPSYAYLDYLVETWRKQGMFTKKAVIDDLERRKAMAAQFPVKPPLYSMSRQQMVDAMSSIREEEILQAIADADYEAEKAAK